MPPRHARALALLLSALGLMALRTAAVPPAAPPPPRPVAREAPAAATLRAGAPLDVNAATVEDLALLPRLGPALARRIVEDRTARGPFRTVDDLTRVPGVGPRTLERVRGLVVARPR